MQPSEFWASSLTEFWWEFDMHVVKSKKVKEVTQKPGRGAGGFTAAEWAAARKKFAETNA